MSNSGKNFTLMGAPRPRGSREAAAFSISRLSGREYRILSLACTGLSETELAEKLGLNRDDVQQSLQAIADKMGLHDCAGLIAYAQRHNLCLAK